MSTWDCAVTAAGTPIPDAGELVRRHLGLSSPREIWASSLYDRATPGADHLTLGDLLAAAALGIRLTRSTLESFDTKRVWLDAALADLPGDMALDEASDDVVERVNRALTGTSLEPTLVAKLLHRGRPRLIPPYDRATTDWYARGLGDRQAGRLPDLLFHIRDDLSDRSNQASLRQLQQLIAVESDGAFVPSRLRLFDIAIWMASTRSK